MNEMEKKMTKMMTKIVLMVPTLVLFAACASKEIKNASMIEPVDLPADESSSYMTPDSEPVLAGNETSSFEPAAAPAVTKTKSKKSKKNAFKPKKKAGRVARNKKKKKAAAVAAISAPATTAVGQVQNTETLPVIGDGNLASAPIAVDPMAPPVPFGMELENNGETQPNWLLAAFVVAGIVGLAGIAFRVRRQSNDRKRKLVFSA